MDNSSQKVTKIDAARRQLGEAIKLFFYSRDSVSIHTLVGAAHQILEDLCTEKGFVGPIQMEAIEENYKDKWIRALRNPVNFFKHANRDGEDTINFWPELTEYLLSDALYMYEGLTESQFNELNVYKTWFTIKYPSLIEDEDIRAALIDAKIRLDLSPDDFEEFQKLL